MCAGVGMADTRKSWHPENPVRHSEFEAVLEALVRRLLDEIYSGSSRPSYTAEAIVQRALDEVYRR